MDPFKKRVTKKDKKLKKEIYTQKYIRLKQMILYKLNKKDGPVQPTSNTL